MPKQPSRKAKADRSHVPQRSPEFEAAMECLTVRLRKEIPHIFDTILDYAQIWDVTTRGRNEHERVHEGTVPMPYLVSHPVPGDPDIRTWGFERLNDSIGYQPTRGPVRKVVFEVCGHDQGWATGPGSWTWWVLSKYTPSESVVSDAPRNVDEEDDSDEVDVDVPEYVDEEDDSDEVDFDVSEYVGEEDDSDEVDFEVPEFVDEEDDSDEVDVDNPESDSEDDDGDKNIAFQHWDWPDGPVLAVNLRAEEVSHVYRVEVDCTSEDEGEIAEFVRSLKPGDRIGIKPRAKYSGWTCYTDWAKITFYTMTYRS